MAYKQKQVRLLVRPPKPGALPPTPEQFALQVYQQLVDRINQDNNKGLLSPTQVTKRMHEAVGSAMLAATHAQRYGDALLLDSMSDLTLDLAERAAFTKAAKVLRGELDPRPVQPVSSKLVMP